jgi:hypothetical protein
VSSEYVSIPHAVGPGAAFAWIERNKSASFRFAIAARSWSVTK